MKINNLGIISVILLLSACAKLPDQVAALEIDSGLYISKSCSKLRAERIKSKQSVADLSAAQKSAANGDVIGVILIGIPTSSLAGNDVEGRLALAKGQVNAIDHAMATKRCKID